MKHHLSKIPACRLRKYLLFFRYVLWDIKTTQLSTVVPIKDTDQVIGYLAIHYPMKNLYESRSNIVEVMRLIFIIIYALFFSFLLIYFRYMGAQTLERDHERCPGICKRKSYLYDPGRF